MVCPGVFDSEGGVDEGAVEIEEDYICADCCHCDWLYRFRCCLGCEKEQEVDEGVVQGVEKIEWGIRRCIDFSEICGVDFPDLKKCQPSRQC